MEEYQDYKEFKLLRDSHNLDTSTRTRKIYELYSEITVNMLVTSAV